jgi:hypothetical protein
VAFHCGVPVRINAMQELHPLIKDKPEDEHA